MQLPMNMSSVTVVGITIRRVLYAVKTLLLSAHTNVVNLISCFCNLISAVSMAKWLER